MDFVCRKLPREAAESLRRVALKELKPYALLPAPLYAFLRTNEKFVALKGPLDCVLPEDLEKWKSFEVLFFPPFVDRTQAYLDAGRRVRQLLTLEAPEGQSPAPYELSDSVLRTLGPLWFAPMQVEPYFLALFAWEVCGSPEASMVIRAREESVERFEYAVLMSGVAVFFALLAGYTELRFIEKIRTQIITHCMQQTSVDAEIRPWVDLAQALLTSDPSESNLLWAPLTEVKLASLQTLVARRLVARLGRVRSDFMTKNRPHPSIFGEGGLLHG